MPSGKQVSWKSLEEGGKRAVADPFTVSAQSPQSSVLTLEGHILPGAGHKAAAPIWRSTA